VNIYDRDSIEFCPVLVDVDGVTPAPGDVEFAIVAYPGRPETADWVAPVVIDDQMGVMVEDLEVGQYEVWVRVSANPETPVLKSDGGIRIM
jgi:hypothetical protein